MNPESNGEDFEVRAREDGWVEQEAWKGPADKWVDAETFVKRGEQFLPIVNARLRKERERTERLEREVAEVRETSQQFRAFSEKALERERKEKEQALVDLEAAKAQAITDGDGATAAKIDKQIRQAERDVAAPPERSGNSEPPEVRAWKDANKWYETDAELSAIADGLSDVVARENPGLKGKAFLDKLTERVQTVVPHKFQNSRRESSTTEGHQARSTTSKPARTYEALSAEAKSHCERFVKTIPGFTKEAFLSQYDWSQQS